MKTKIRRYNLFRICLAVIILAILVPAALCAAQGGRPEHYPAKFSGHGCIDRITADKVVIDDQLFKLVRGVTFHTPKIKNASRARFRPGDHVGWVNNSKKEIESLWYIKKCER